MSLTPVRKIKPSSRSITGKRSSSKTNVSQHFESTLERDFLTLLEYDDKVDDYGVQPITIHYENKGRAARYTPDMLVYFKSHVARKPLLVEIKYFADLKKDIELLKPKFRAADIYARENGLEFNVLTEADIRTAYLINVKFLSKYCIGTIAIHHTEAILNLIKIADIATPTGLLDCFPETERSDILYTLWQLLATKIITCDMQQKITMTTQVWITKNF